jgi:branched-chain amino acid transport system permease protein
MNAASALASARMAEAAAAPAAARRWRWMAAFALVVLAGLFLVPLFVNAFYLGLLVRAALLGISAVGVGFLMHQCGMVMFGAAAFIGLPAYFVAVAAVSWGWGTGASVAFALLASTLCALAIGMLVTRARPLPFAMLTLALAQMLKSVSTLQPLRPYTGGGDGLSITFNGPFLGLDAAAMSMAQGFWPVVWLALCAAVLAAWVAANSRFGRVLRAITANEERMRFCGFGTWLPRLAAFTLACFIVSVSGVLMALNAGFVSPELLDFGIGGNVLVSMLVGVASSAAGPVLGALLYTWGQDIFGSTGHLELLTGLGVVLVIWLFPQGLFGFLRQGWDRMARGARKGGR